MNIEEINYFFFPSLLVFLQGIIIFSKRRDIGEIKVHCVGSFPASVANGCTPVLDKNLENITSKEVIDNALEIGFTFSLYSFPTLDN